MLANVKVVCRGEVYPQELQSGLSNEKGPANSTCEAGGSLPTISNYNHPTKSRRTKGYPQLLRFLFATLLRVYFFARDLRN